MDVDHNPSRSYPFVKTEETAPAIERMSISTAYRLMLCSSVIDVEEYARRRISNDMFELYPSNWHTHPDLASLDDLHKHRLLHDTWSIESGRVSSVEEDSQSLRQKYEIPESELVWYHNDIVVSTRLRRLFLTNDDLGLMGLAPDRARPGDVVAIIEGAYVPVILRKVSTQQSLLDEAQGSGTSWNLVGNAYVQGIMDGEGLTLGEMEPIIIV